MIPKTHRETFILNTAMCDLNSAWRPGAMMTSMQETAAAHCQELGVGRLDLLKQTDDPMQKIVPISVSNELCEAPVPVAPQPAVLNSSGSVVMRKDGIEIELPQNFSEDTILALLRGLKQS